MQRMLPRPSLRAALGVMALLLLGRVAYSAQTTPVVVVPGFLGSKLEDAGGVVVWGDALATIRNFPRLEVPVAGGAGGLRPAGLLDAVNFFGPFEIKQYGSLIDFLKREGFVEGQTLFEFAYDWRQSNFDSARALQAFVENTPALRQRRFRMLGHSMGGLVALVYIQELGGAGRVERLVTLGTPYKGSLNALRAILEEPGGLLRFLPGGDATFKRVVLSFPSLFELLPRYENCCLVGRANQPGNTPVDVLKPETFVSRSWLPKEFRASPAKMEFLEHALAAGVRLRQLADRPAPGGTAVSRVAGGLISTTTQVFLPPALNEPAVFREFGGDGTVPVVSAANGDMPASFVAIQKHATIFDDKHVQEQLRRTLKDDVGLRPFAGIQLRDTTRDQSGKEVRVTAISVEVERQYQALGEVNTVAVEVRDDALMRVPALGPVATVTGPGGSIKRIWLEETSDAIYTAELPPATEPGVWTIEVEIKGLARVQEYYAAVPDPAVKP